MLYLKRGTLWILLIGAAMAGAGVPTGLDLKLLKALTSRLDENQAIAPFVLSSLMTQVWLGATGTTRSQISSVLGLNGSSPLVLARAFLPAYKFAISQLSAGNSNATTAVFNRIYVRSSFSINPTFSKILEIFYGTDVKRFSSTAQAVAEINAAVAEVTRDCIKDLASADALQNTMMVLLSALYFKGLWYYAFNRSVRQPFLTTSGEKEVDMMKLKKRLSYRKMRTFDALALPYKDRDYCMLLLRPMERSMAAVGKLRDSLDSLNVANIIRGLRKWEVRVSMPSFKINTKYSLKDPMSLLGMTKIFSAQADFHGISRFPLFVSDIYHKVFIEVTANGTEAAGAAAAVVHFFSRSARPLPIRFKLDRPFFAILYNKKHKINMFSAYIASP